MKMNSSIVNSSNWGQMNKTIPENIKDFICKPTFDQKVLLNRDPQFPRISIVTPSFNQGQFLERTILSVLNQNYPNLEYIIIDGASTDSSVEIIKKYEKYIAYWVSEKDSGQSDAINKGFARATGQIYAYLNSDDIYLPDLFTVVADIFSQNPKISLLYGNKLIIDSNDKVISERRVTHYTYLSRLGFIYGGFGVYQPASFWSKSIYDLSGGVDVSLKFCMDNDLFHKFLILGGKFQFLHRYFAGFRVHDSSKTSTLNKTAIAESILLTQRYNLKRNSFFAKSMWFFVRVHRMILYVLQGDIDYLFFKVLKDKFKWVP